MEPEWIFDIPWAKSFNKTREGFAKEFLQLVGPSTELLSALDVGCGVGEFSKFLSDLSFTVMGIDGREANITEARRRYPHISFRAENAEELLLATLGVFDLVLCFGLLYHLENPFRVIRRLHAVTGKILLIETMCVPGGEPMMDLLDEGTSENQGLNYVAFYPSQSCLIKMLYRAGFPFVYRFKRLPNDELFRPNLWRKQQRIFLAASKVALSAPNLVLAKEHFRLVPTDLDPWGTTLSRARHRLFQVRVLAARALRPMLRAVGAKSK